MQLIVQPGRLVLMRDKLAQVLVGEDARALGELIYTRAKSMRDGLVMAPFPDSETEIFLDQESALSIGGLLSAAGDAQAGQKAVYEIHCQAGVD
ncbi:MAG: hypothetical protein R6U22_09540 [Desulfohalobiaceae bacterium]